MLEYLYNVMDVMPLHDMSIREGVILVLKYSLVTFVLKLKLLFKFHSIINKLYSVEKILASRCPYLAAVGHFR